MKTGAQTRKNTYDKSRMEVLFHMAENAVESDVSVSILLADSVRKEAILGGDTLLQMRSCSLLGRAWFYKHQYERAIDWFTRYLNLALDSRNQKEEASAYNSLGIVYANWDFSKGLKYYRKALDIKEQLRDSAGISSVMNNIGTIYDIHLKDYPKAFTYYNKSWEIEKKIGTPEGIATSMLNVGDVYRKMGRVKESRQLLTASYELADSIHNLETAQIAADCLFRLEEGEKNWKEALRWHQQHADLKEELIHRSQQQQVAELEVRYKTEEQSAQIRLLKSEQGINERERRNQRYALYLMGIMVLGVAAFSWLIFEKSKSIRKANELLKTQHEEINQQQQELKKQAELLEQSNEELTKLSVVASKTDNSVIVAAADGEIEWVNDGFTRLLGISFQEFRERYTGNLFTSSLNPDIRKVVKEAVRDRKSVQYTCRTVNRDGRELWFQTTLTPILDEQGGLLKLIAIDTDVTRLKNTEIQLGVKQEELTDSIRYALKIQQSMLPPPAVFEAYFNNHFLIYQPRDIVSGDFYWLTRMGERICIAAADCTGHGVPGAFMSIIGISLLNEVFHALDGEEFTAAEVLTRLRLMMKQSLSTGQEKSEMHDGMDFSLCIIDLQKNEMQFSGAYHSVFVMHQMENRFEEVHGDKMPIGDYPTDKQYFTNHLIRVQEKDIIYLQSDGFWHQMGGPAEKKFGKKRYVEMLKEISSLDFDQQKQLIKSRLDAWMSAQSQAGQAPVQMDDVMVIGCRL